MQVTRPPLRGGARFGTACSENGEFRGLVEAGTRWFFDPLGKVRVDVVSQRDPWLVHEKLDLIVKSGAIKCYSPKQS